MIIAGPTTLVALLNSLQVGFRTLAIESARARSGRSSVPSKPSSAPLATSSPEFKRSCNRPQSDIETVGTKARTMQRKLREVENTAVNASDDVFGFANVEDSSARPDLPENSEESNRQDAA